MYKEAITKSGFNDDIIYTPLIESNNSKRQNTRKRKIIRFNPLYSMNVETNIGKIFLKLVKKNIFHAIEVFIKYSTRTTLTLVIVASEILAR